MFAQAFAGEPDLAHLTVAARRVLAMSAALFYRQGAAATSIRDITRACGLTPGALYSHFASKDDVLYLLVRHGHERLERRIAAALEASSDEPVERTSAFVRAYVMGHLVQPELAQVVRREYLHLSQPRRHEIVRRRRELRDQLTDLLRDGELAGVFDLIGDDDGPTRVGVMVLDMCSRTSEWYDPTRSDATDDIADRYTTAALRLAGRR
jgi:AcrR family transcriptional regulator